MENDTSIEKLIEKSLKGLSKIGEENAIRQDAESRLIFPIYYHGDNAEKNRMSEQEARFLFVRELENQDEFYYSVETPTEEKYRGFASKNPELSEDGRSGAIDVTLYDRKGKRVALVEFKYGASEKADIEKDFLKLLVDNSKIELNYFIHIVEKLGDELLKSIKDKYTKSLESLKDKLIEKDKSEFKIFLFAVEPKKIVIYKVNKNLSLNQIKEV